MKTILGLVGILAGVALGLYVGVYLMLIGGIMGLVSVVTTAIAGGTIVGSLVAWSIVKIMFAGITGFLSAWMLIVPSYGLLIHSLK